jgi:anaerobic selenocysteine-containing dehydrogenase
MGIDDEFFRLTEEELIARLIAQPSPMWNGVDKKALAENRAIRLSDGCRHNVYRTPSGKIEIRNPREEHPLPAYLPTHEEQGDFPLRLMTAPNPYCLNSSFNEQEGLRQKQEGMLLLMNPADADRHDIKEGERIIAFNDVGEVEFILRITDKTPPGVVVAEGVWWIAHAPGSRTVNALTSQRLTDQGKGSTFYDNRVGVKRKV